MKCPICRRVVEESEPHYPFCSERCKLIDLGRWASEGYVISTPLESEPRVNQQADEDSE